MAQRHGVERRRHHARAFGCRDAALAQRQFDVLAHRFPGNRLRPYSWNTTAMSCGGAVTSRPFTVTAPRVGANSPARHFSSVVLPAPEGPTMQVKSPGRTSKLRSPIASTRRSLDW